MNKISVIIPVYNSEKYISRCIDSIIAQSYENWELILVNDGSTDNSLNILNHYKQKDFRIFVYSQKNKGPGAARNLGIKNASGDYIVFIDSDDFISANYFELLSTKNEDIVFIDIEQIDDKSRKIKSEYMSKYAVLSKDKLIRGQMTGLIPWGGVRKAVRRKLIVNNNICYSKFKIGEEAIYSFLILYYAKNFSFINTPVYSYVIHDKSLSHTKNLNPWEDVATSLKNTIVNMSMYATYCNTLNAFFLNAYIISMYRYATYNDYNSFKDNFKNIIEKISITLDNDYSIDFKNLPLRIILLYLLVKLRFRFLFYLICKFRNIFNN